MATKIIQSLVDYTVNNWSLIEFFKLIFASIKSNLLIETSINISFGTLTNFSLNWADKENVYDFSLIRKIFSCKFTSLECRSTFTHSENNVKILKYTEFQCFQWIDLFSKKTYIRIVLMITQFTLGRVNKKKVYFKIINSKYSKIIKLFVLKFVKRRELSCFCRSSNANRSKQ